MSACAAPRGGGSSGSGGSDNCGRWLVAGAIGGILTQGGNSGRSKVGGALVGAAAAYALCKAITAARYSVQQKKTERQVQEEYIRSAGRPPPASATVTGHELQVMQTRGTDDKGKGVTYVNVRSDIVVLAGAQASPRVEEQVVLLAPDGTTRLGNVRKTAGTAGGGYGANTQITLPDGLEDGQYEIRHIVLLDGVEKSERTARFSYVAGSWIPGAGAMTVSTAGGSGAGSAGVVLSL